MFTAEQIALLDRPLSREHVKARPQAGRQLSYIESHHAIREANRIFGFHGWSSETLDIRCIRETGEEASYMARVRVTVFAGERTVIKDGVGFGHGKDRSNLGQAHEKAAKEAESDAQKRALRHFGDQFGLALYDKDQANVVDEPAQQPAPRQPAPPPVDRVPDNVPRSEAVEPPQRPDLAASAPIHLDPKAAGRERRRTEREDNAKRDSLDARNDLLYHLDRMRPGARDWDQKWGPYEQMAKVCKMRLIGADASMINRREADLQTKHRAALERRQTATA